MENISRSAKVLINAESVGTHVRFTFQGAVERKTYPKDKLAPFIQYAKTPTVQVHLLQPDRTWQFIDVDPTVEGWAGAPALTTPNLIYAWIEGIITGA